MFIAIYIAMNMTYIYALPLDEIAKHETIAHAAATALFSPAAALWLSALIAVSCFGAMASCTMSGARVYYAMARDGAFFQEIGGGPSQVANPRLQPDRARNLVSYSYRERSLRPALHLRDVRHGALVHHDRAWAFHFALEAAGHTTSVSLHRISLAAREFMS